MDEDEIKRNDKRLRDLKRSFRNPSATRSKREFYCPILEVNEPAELCRGHIVPKSVHGRSWVVQRKDVDNFFGTFAEAGFGHGVKLRSMELEDAMQYVFKHKLAGRAELFVEDPTGARGSVRPIKRSGDGWLVGIQPEDAPVDVGAGLSMSIKLDVRYETLLTCLHSAHLGLFEAAGYGYVASSPGRFVARLLRHVYKRFSGAHTRRKRKSAADSSELARLCMPYTNMVRPLTSVDGLNQELLDQPFKSFVLCWCGQRLFATIHMLPADDEWNAAMVFAELDLCALAIIAARVPISFRTTVGQLRDGRIHAGPVRGDSTTMVWTCGEHTSGMKPCPIERAVTAARQMPPPY